MTSVVVVDCFMSGRNRVAVVVKQFPANFDRKHRCRLNRRISNNKACTARSHRIKHSIIQRDSRNLRFLVVRVEGSSAVANPFAAGDIAGYIVPRAISVNYLRSSSAGSGIEAHEGISLRRCWHSAGYGSRCCVKCYSLIRYYTSISSIAFCACLLVQNNSVRIRGPLSIKSHICTHRHICAFGIVSAISIGLCVPTCKGIACSRVRIICGCRVGTCSMV